MNKSDLVTSVAQSANISKAASEKALNGLLKIISDGLAAGDSVTLTGFGRFSVSTRASRTGRNPQSGTAIKIPAKKVVRFKAGKSLSEVVK